MRSHGKGSESATTQVKVLSPEITHIAQGEEFHVSEANNNTRGKGECVVSVSGSKSVAGERIVCSGTWENRSVPNGSFQGAEKATRRYGAVVVGPTHSRGVGGVMPVECEQTHSKGSAVECRELTSDTPYAERGETWQKLSLIAGHARREPQFQFTSLAHLLNVEYLRDCYYSLNRNKAVGVDHVSFEEYGQELEANLEQLVDRLKRKKYKPQPARRVYIPKSATEKRPLGIPAIESKIVERGITWILESIYEQDFLDCSYGFRPQRSCHQALKALNDELMFQPVNHIVEADIKGFFDTVPHEQLMEFIQIRINDTSLLNLIRKFLKAGYIDDGVLVKPEAGTPQGSILSPMLANIFLHYVLDMWFEQTVKSQAQGYCALFRYADDFICVLRYAGDAERIERELHTRFNKYGMQLHPTKSRKISFGRFEQENAHKQNRRANTFDFLGFTHYCAKSRVGRFKVGRKTSRKKFAAKCREMNSWLKATRNQVKTKDWWKILVAKLRGHYNYYGVSENYVGIVRFYRVTVKAVRKWMNRRSQKKKMSWSRYYQYLEHYPLPKPFIVHSFYGSLAQ
jgi:group II intron reverse transcriptase/maturase